MHRIERIGGRAPIAICVLSLFVALGCEAEPETQTAGPEALTRSNRGALPYRSVDEAGPSVQAGETEGSSSFNHGTGPTVGGAACASTPFGVGCFCSDFSECASGFCVEVEIGSVCVEACPGGVCPAEHACVPVDTGGPIPEDLCLPRFEKLCQPCDVDADCTAAGETGPTLCIDYGAGEGSYCGAFCVTDGDCPTGHLCQDFTLPGGGETGQCILADSEATCGCNDVGVLLGMSTECSSSNGFGTCVGVRSCTVAGLSACSAATPAVETCDGIDNNCDGEIDNNVIDCSDGDMCTADFCIFNLGGCQNPDQSAACNDGNPCTADSCDSGTGCVFSPSSGANCNDGNPCTFNDTCSVGVCGGTLNPCDDGNPCTDDVCDATLGCLNTASSGAACNDGNVCTLNDTCVTGVCTGTLQVCDDGDPCTDDACDDTAGCETTPASGAACDDGNSCTSGDLCVVGACIGSPVPACCGSAADCDDGNPCTIDSCDVGTGVCTNDSATLEGTACNADGSGCTANDVCVSGSCQLGTAVDCGTSAQVCLSLECLSTGINSHVCVLVPSNSGEPCTDGNPCTTGDACDGGGSCVSFGTVPSCCTQDSDCEDGDPCTLDSCDEATGACSSSNAPDGLACNADGNGCTADDTCQAGACQAGAAVSCPASGNVCLPNTCTSTSPFTWSCNPTPALTGTACNDFNVCTDGDQCNGLGACVGTPVANCCTANSQCDDGNQCTSNNCNLTDGSCFNPVLPGGTACDDGDACTTGDQCTAGVCNGTQMACNDGNPCTNDFCDAGFCTTSPATTGAPCDDGNPCTINDQCTPTGCQGTPLNCGDGNPCTEDQCVGGACSNTNFANGTACDDGDACTTNDQCTAGVCGGSQMNCGDGNPCTTDACVGGSCTNTPVANGTGCNDGDACTTSDQCTAGVCGGTDMVCNDGNPCTNDFCQAGACMTTPVNNGVACSDSNQCTFGDNCQAGTCTGTLQSCNDGNPCTNDVCDPGTGNCSNGNVADGTACDDGDLCTINDQCTAGVCGGTLLNCDDGNACTSNTCTGTGCSNPPLPNGTTCTDGDACTISDQCVGGSCTGAALNCTDGNPCTLDQCDAGICTFPAGPDGVACNDGNNCTTNDQCTAGACGGTAIGCDDGNPCTTDSCTGSGCLNQAVPNGSACTDGNACTTGDSCQAGSCTGTPMNCDDGNDCTSDSCSGGSCLHANNPVGTVCDDGDACTHTDRCQAGGVCQGLSTNCDDGNSCTNDACNAATGNCQHFPVADGTACNDGEACTTNDQCVIGVCTGTAPPRTFALTDADDFSFILFGSHRLMLDSVVGDLVLTWWDDGSARITGTVHTDGMPATPANAWAVDIWLDHRGRGAAGVGSGGPKFGTGFDVNQWEFFDMRMGAATLTRNATGEVLSLTQKPANGRSPFQMGFGASGKNANFGASVWFTYLTSTGGSGSGDANVDVTETTTPCP